MLIIVVRSFKRKALIFSAVLLLWAFMFLLANGIVRDSLLLKITINNYLTFSYPLAFEISNIFVNEQADSHPVEVSAGFKKPVARQLSKFKSEEGHFSFDYPASFELSRQYFGGSDILYHIDFQNKAPKAHGFVQVWNLPYSLQEFLDKSMDVSQQNYGKFTSKPVTVNENPGYFWDYTVLGKDGSHYKGQEVFIKKGDRMYRISYFVPETSWNQSQSDLFWGMVRSFKTL